MERYESEKSALEKFPDMQGERSNTGEILESEGRGKRTSSQTVSGNDYQNGYVVLAREFIDGDKLQRAGIQ